MTGILTPEELESNIVLYDPEKEKAKYERQQRISLCGSPIWMTDPLTAKMRRYTSSCKMWRECPKCFQARVDKFEERYKRATFQSGDVRVLVLDSEEDARIICRKLRRDDSLYWRIPTEIGIVILFDGEQTELIGPDELPEFEMLARTLEGKRYTGKLGKEMKTEPEEDEGEVLTVTVLKFGKIEGLDDRAIEMCAEMANKIVNRIPKFSVADIEYMSGLTMEEFAKNIHAVGGKVLYKERSRVKVSKRAYDKVFKDRHVMTQSDQAIAAFNAETAQPQYSIEQFYA